jgi:ribonucleoside-diphosphate reductase alpha chain
MAILRIDHPDIEEFIDAKRDQRSLQNFNISVGVTSEFMRAVGTDGKLVLRDPGSGRAVRELRAKEVFERIADAAWSCGDPGLVFLDQIARFNPTPREGALESTNPCGEQPLLPYESCNLGSLNLGEYWHAGQVDWAALGRDVHVAVRFLDDVIDVNAYPLRQCRDITLRNRKIGLGVMGFADLLLLAGIPYGNEEAVRLGERIMSLIDREGKAASAALAQERGAFANWRGSLWDRLGYPRLRNATVSTVAPTGTISLIAGASSGIEPIFAGVYFRNVLSGERLTEVHPAVASAFRARGADLAGVSEARILAELGSAWTPAHRVSVDAHIRTQAVFQRHSDSAVSKTINLPEHATRGDVAYAYLQAYRHGCKGITVYRNLSKPGQVLEHPKPPADREGRVCPVC